MIQPRAQLTHTEVDIRSPRPGVINLYHKKTGRLIGMVGTFCQDCLTISNHALDYSVDTELWNKLVPENGLICRKCLIKRNNNEPIEFKEFEPITPSIIPELTKLQEKLQALPDSVLQKAWERVSKDIHMFDYPRFSWTELEHLIKGKD